MIGRFTFAVAALVLSAGIFGCSNVQGSKINPSGGQPTGPAIRTAAGTYKWITSKTELSAGRSLFTTKACSGGSPFAISGGYRTAEIGPDVTVMESFPSNDAKTWTFRASNHSSSKRESVEYYVLCAQ